MKKPLKSTKGWWLNKNNYFEVRAPSLQGMDVWSSCISQIKLKVVGNIQGLFVSSCVCMHLCILKSEYICFSGVFLTVQCMYTWMQAPLSIMGLTSR